ncbi:MAG: type II toxin-antitoxin system HicA family toxin [Chloroflexota bacterium]
MTSRKYSSREVLRILLKDGWMVKGQRGSHLQLVHPTKPGKVTVQHPRHEIALPVLKSIEKQAGIRLD